jgi:hypothetical protein
MMLSWRLSALVDRFWMWVAFHLPHRLVTWCAIRVMATATTGRWSDQVVPELTVEDMLWRWEHEDDEEAEAA